MDLQTRKAHAIYFLAFAHKSPAHAPRSAYWNWLAIGLGGNAWNFLSVSMRLELTNAAEKEVELVGNEFDIRVGGKRTLPWWISDRDRGVYLDMMNNDPDNGGHN